MRWLLRLEIESEIEKDIVELFKKLYFKNKTLGGVNRLNLWPTKETQVVWLERQYEERRLKKQILSVVQGPMDYYQWSFFFAYNMW